MEDKIPKVTYRALVRFFAGMYSHVDQQLVAGVERSLRPRAVQPVADIFVAMRGIYMVTLDVVDQGCLARVNLPAVLPATFHQA
jgi:hypothetical protein